MRIDIMLTFTPAVRFEQETTVTDDTGDTGNTGDTGDTTTPPESNSLNLSLSGTTLTIGSGTLELNGDTLTLG